MIVRDYHCVLGINDIEDHDPGDHDDGIVKAIAANVAAQTKQDEWYLKRGILLPEEVESHRFSRWTGSMSKTVVEIDGVGFSKIPVEPDIMKAWLDALLPDTANDYAELDRIGLEAISRKWSPERTDECPVEDIHQGGFIESDEQLRERLKNAYRPRTDDIISQIERELHDPATHATHGRGTAEDGPDGSDCACRTTTAVKTCAEAGCGFCLAEES